MDVFFFSSRRRHTRYWRDWSSDVCSSDLFSHYEAMTEEQIKAVEQRVNEKISEAIAVEISHKTMEEAKACGAMMLFGDKYGDTVRRSEEHTSELQSRQYLVCRLLLEKKKSQSV